MNKCPICNHKSKKDMLICEQCGAVIDNNSPPVTIKGSRTIGKWSK